MSGNHHESISTPSTAMHLGSEGDYGDIDIEKMIEDMGCSKAYYALEECLGEYNRDWTKCQYEVKALKACNDQLQALKKRKE